MIFVYKRYTYYMLDIVVFSQFRNIFLKEKLLLLDLETTTTVYRPATERRQHLHLQDAESRNLRRLCPLL